MSEQKLETGRGYHDIGGMRAGPIDRSEHAVPRWAKTAEAIRRLVDDRYCLHEQRRRIEGLGPKNYERLSYFELRVEAMAQALVEKGVLTEAEIAARMKTIGNDGDPEER